MNMTQTTETATDSTVTITADHGMVDSKGRRLGGYAEIKSGDLGIAVRIYSTRDGKQFGASFPRPTVHARGEMAAARKQALKSLAAQGARCAKMEGATAVDQRTPSQRRADAPIEARAAAAKVAPAAPAAATTVTEAQKRTVACPKCKRAAGSPCRKIGTGGAMARDLMTAHRERRAAYLAQAPKCPGVDDAALASRAADLRASVGSIPGMTPEPTLADSLRARGMTYRLAATDGKCDILRDGEVVFCGTAGETWEWLRAPLGPIIPTRCTECVGGVAMEPVCAPKTSPDVTTKCPKCRRAGLAKRLQLGDGVTMTSGSDRFPCTVVEIISETRIAVREDKAKRTDNNGDSEVQTWTYERDDSAPRRVVTLRKSGWRDIDGHYFHLGSRRRFHDFAF